MVTSLDSIGCRPAPSPGLAGKERNPDQRGLHERKENGRDANYVVESNWAVIVDPSFPWVGPDPSTDWDSVGPNDTVQALAAFVQDPGLVMDVVVAGWLPRHGWDCSRPSGLCSWSGYPKASPRV